MIWQGELTSWLMVRSLTCTSFMPSSSGISATCSCSLGCWSGIAGPVRVGQAKGRSGLWAYLHSRVVSLLTLTLFSAHLPQLKLIMGLQRRLSVIAP